MSPDIKLMDVCMIIPAVIPTSRHHLEVTVDLFASFSDTCQVDVVDGVFDDSVSWPFNVEEQLVETLKTVRFDELAVELDLMVQNPEETLDVWLSTKPTRIIVHVESTHKLDEIIKHASTHGYQLGLAFGNDTDLALLQEVDMAGVDIVQLMGIAEIGEQGNPFDERVLERIKIVKDMFPNLPVSIDGGVSLDAITRLKKAGADRFVSGSAILKSPEPSRAYKDLCRLAGCS